jgi:N-methylhydantoinase A
MLLADRIRDYAAGVLNSPGIEREFERLERSARKELPGSEMIRSADIRYNGQSYELTVAWHAKNPGEPFHREHQRVYGYANPDRAIEIVTIRVRAKLTVERPRLTMSRSATKRRKPAPRRIHSAGAWRNTSVHARGELPKSPLRGPALVIDYGSTTLIPPGWRFSLDKFGNLKITS